MRTFTREELNGILTRHRAWYYNEPNGERADLSGANLRSADLSGANLRSADLRSADLSGANLRSADLSHIHEDFTTKLALQKDEVVGLYKALWEGRVDGSTYSGECACFVGTIANIKGCPYGTLAVTPDADSPTERFFLGIYKGDTPDNNQISAIVVDWMIAFMLDNDLNVPTLVKSWEE